MAELGSGLLNATEGAVPKIEVEMLDYEYVRNCTDWKTLNAILDILKSGREGHYPDLIRVTEEKLLECLPGKERKKYLSINRIVSKDEVLAADNELEKWMTTIQSTDTALSSSQRRSKILLGDHSQSSLLPAVRGTVPIFDKTDRDGKEGDREADHVDSSVEFAKDIISKKQIEKLIVLRKDLRVREISELQQKHRANLEKIKGNESFRVSENQEAMNYYSKSLAYDPCNSIVWANRAMTYIRLELFDLAEDDSSVAIFLDPSYTKAYSRRGLVRFKRGKYAAAVDDFQKALEIDPNNTEMRKLMEKAHSKYVEVEGATYEKCADTSESLFSESTERIPFSVVSSVSGLPNFDGGIVLDSGHLRNLSGNDSASVTPFVRVNVISEDESDDDETTDGTSSMRRIEIMEDDEESDDTSPATESVAAGYDRTPMESAEVQGEAERLKEEGNQLLKGGDILAAIDSYSRSLDVLPSYQPSLNNRAQAYLLNKNYIAAIDDCNSVLSTDPNNLKALYRRGTAHLSIGDVVIARRDVNSILSIDACNSQAKKLSEKLISVESRHCGGSVTEDGPNLIDLKSKAQKMLEAGDNDSVIGLLGGFLRGSDSPFFTTLIENDRISMLHLLATAYNNVEDHEHALFAYDLILSIDSSNGRALKKKFDIISRSMKHESAEEREIKLRSFITDLDKLGKGLLRDDIMELRKSVDDELQRGSTESSSTIVPDEMASNEWKEQGNKAMSVKDYQAAIDCYSKSVALNAHNIAAFNNRALAHLKLSEYESAERDASVVLSFNEKDVDPTLRKKALCRRAQARRSNGQHMLQKQSDIGGNNSIALSSFGGSNSADVTTARKLLNGALEDLDEWLSMDVDNKSAVNERKATIQWLEFCEKAITKKSTTTASTKKNQPKKEKKDYSSKLILPSKVATGRSDLGMTAVSTKKFKEDAAAESKCESSTALYAAEEDKPENVESMLASPKSSEMKSNRKLGTSPPLTFIPREPPKTVYELERVWRGLRNSPEKFAEYLSIFKKSTYKKILKDSVSPDLISFMLTTLRDNVTSTQTKAKALRGLSSSANFSLTYSLLPERDLDCVRSIIEGLECDLSFSRDELMDLCSAYDVSL